MAKTKKFSDFMAICFVFWANISTGLWDLLGCSDLSQIFFGSSPTGIEWDQIVAGIIITTFVFLGHPRASYTNDDWIKSAVYYSQNMHPEFLEMLRMSSWKYFVESIREKYQATRL